MGYSFKTVAKGMGVVVERVDAPLVSCMGMGSVTDAIDDRVSQSCIGVFVVYFGP